MGQAGGGDNHYDNERYISKLNDSWAANDIAQKEEIKDLTFKIKELIRTNEVQGKAIQFGKDKFTDRRKLYESLEIQYKALLGRTVPYLQQFNALSHIEEESINDLLVDIDEVLND